MSRSRKTPNSVSLAGRRERGKAMRASWVAGVALLFAAGAAPAARADCVSDCTSAYQAAMAACEAKYKAPDQEISLQSCEDAAQDQLATCTDSCEPEGSED